MLKLTFTANSRCLSTPPIDIFTMQTNNVIAATLGKLKLKLLTKHYSRYNLVTIKEVEII